MKKTEVIHTRVSPEVKAECDYIFSQLGITTSYAISLFLSQVSLRKGIPFEVTLPEKEDLASFAENINLVDSGKPSEEAKIIIRLFEQNLIDEKTAKAAIRRFHNL